MLGLEESQTQGVGHYKHRAEAHSQRRHHRIHLQIERCVPASGGDGDADNVVEEGPKQVLFDIADGGLGEFNGSGHIQQVAAHQHNIGGLHGYIGACTNGNPHIGTGQSRSVVDAIAHHGHLLAALLELADLLLLILRKYLGYHTVYTYLFANGLGGLFMVTGKHDYFNTHGLKISNGLLAGGLHHICHCDHADELTRRSKEQRCLALIRHLILKLFQSLVVDALGIQ